MFTHSHNNNSDMWKQAETIAAENHANIAATGSDITYEELVLFTYVELTS